MDRKIIDDLEHEAYEAERLEHALPVKEQENTLLKEKEGNNGILVDPNSLGQIVAIIQQPWSSFLLLSLYRMIAWKHWRNRSACKR